MFGGYTTTSQLRPALSICRSLKPCSHIVTKGKSTYMPQRATFICAELINDRQFVFDCSWWSWQKCVCGCVFSASSDSQQVFVPFIMVCCDFVYLQFSLLRASRFIYIFYRGRWFYLLVACYVLYRMSGWVRWKAHATLLCQVCACYELLIILYTVTREWWKCGIFSRMYIKTYVFSGLRWLFTADHPLKFTSAAYVHGPSEGQGSTIICQCSLFYYWTGSTARVC